MTHADLHALRARQPLPPVARLLFALAALLVAWDNRQHTRRALARLDDHLLRDIGLCRESADEECAKPFWKD